MGARNEAAKGDSIELDPSAAVIMNGIITLLKCFIKLLYKSFTTAIYLIQRARGKTVSSVEVAIKETAEAKEKVKTTILSENRVFLNYGSVRWVSDISPEAARKLNRRTHPNAEQLKINYLLEKELKQIEVTIFGDVSEAQSQNIEFAIQCAIEEKKAPISNLKEIHVLKDLGRFLDSNGTPDNHVPGFTLDESGACLLTHDLSLRSDWCNSFFAYVIQDELNYQHIRTKAQDALWNQSATIRTRIKLLRDYRDPDTRYKSGTLRGRHIVDQDCGILGGVFLSHPAKEAVTIDPDSETLTALYTKFPQEIRRIKAPLGIALEEQTLAIANQLALSAFPRSNEQSLKHLRESSRISTDEEVPLEFFVKAEIGDIGHKVLLAGYLLDRLRMEQGHYLQGKISIDRNWLPGGGHIWIRYTHSSDDIYIVDPVRKFCGRLDKYCAGRWPYERKEDLLKPRKARPID